MTYSRDKAIRPLNNWGQDFKKQLSCRKKLLSSVIPPFCFLASVDVFLRFLQKEYQWGTSSVKLVVVNKLSKDDVTSVRLLAPCWRDVQAYFSFGMRKMVEKELRNRGMIA